jgi:putative mRNA 3-end processing factor
MRFSFHGATREVGRSCIEIASENRRFLLDCGIKISENGTQYPIGCDDPRSLDAVFISHAHLDHTGALPRFDHDGMNCPIISTHMTKVLTSLLLHDAFKIGKLSHEQLGYEEEDIDSALRCMDNVDCRESGSIAGVKYEYFDAGHIPGSALVKLDLEGKRLLYTGDFNPAETELLKGSATDFSDTDVLVMESTYGDRDHPSRYQTERRFINSIEETLVRGGKVLVPSFAVGRAQELLLVLAKKDWGVPVYIDGMALDATKIVLDLPDTLKDAKALKDALSCVREVHKRDRNKLMGGPCIIVTTSGMLTGGPVMHYIKNIHSDPDSSILLTGYQAKETNGRLLLDNGYVFVDGFKTSVKCSVDQFDFSAHAGAKELKDFVRKVSPQKMFLVHGDPESVENMRLWAEALGFDVDIPVLGEVFTVQ